jgi:hypothetical protein
LLVNDIGNEITNSIPRDGTAPPTGNIPFGNYKITGLGAATLATDAAQFQQIQSGSANYLTAVAGTNTITASLTSPTLTALAVGNTFRFLAAATNNGAATININGLGAKTLQKNGVALVSGDIALGVIIEIVYDGTNFQITGGLGNFIQYSPLNLIGYGSGAGGSVTQLTSKATAVTINRPNGAITLNNSAVASNTPVAFTVNNSLVSVGDAVLLSIADSITSNTAYSLTVANISNGSFIINIRNVSVGTLSDAVIIKFQVFKGANT